MSPDVAEIKETTGAAAYMQRQMSP